MRYGAAKQVTLKRSKAKAKNTPAVIRVPAEKMKAFKRRGRYQV